MANGAGQSRPGGAVIIGREGEAIASTTAETFEQQSLPGRFRGGSKDLKPTQVATQEAQERARILRERQQAQKSLQESRNSQLKRINESFQGRLRSAKGVEQKRQLEQQRNKLLEQVNSEFLFKRGEIQTAAGSKDINKIRASSNIEAPTIQETVGLGKQRTPSQTRQQIEQKLRKTLASQEDLRKTTFRDNLRKVIRKVDEAIPVDPGFPITTTRKEREALQSLIPQSKTDKLEKQARSLIKEGGEKLEEKIDEVTNTKEKKAENEKKFSEATEKIKSDFNSNKLTEAQAQKRFEKAQKSFLEKEAQRRILANLLTGAAIGAVSGALPPVGAALGVGLTASAITRRKQIAAVARASPKAFLIETGALLAGSGGGLVLGKGLKLNLKNFNKDLKGLAKDKRGSTFLEAAQVLKKKKKKKPELSRKQALEQFKAKFREEQVAVIERSIRNLDKISKADLDKIKKFMREAGLKEFAVNDRLAEAFRRLQVKTLRQARQQGAIDGQQFSKEFTRLKNLRQQLTKRLREQSTQEFRIVQKKIQQGQVQQQAQAVQKQGGVVKLAERTESPLAARSKTLQGQPLGQRFNQAQSAKSKLATGLVAGSAFAASAASALSQPSLSKQKQKEKLRTPLIPVPKLRSINLLKKASPIKKVPEIPGKPSPKKPKKPKVPKSPILPKPSIPKGKKLFKPIRVIKNPGFNAFYKRRGKFLKINKKPLIKKHAESLGSFVTDHSLAASFKIKKAGKPAQKSTLNFPKTHFRTNQRKFRKGKTVSGLVERRKFRLDTLRERRKIQAARLIASIRKPKFKRL